MPETQHIHAYKWHVVVTPAPRSDVASPSYAMVGDFEAREWWEVVEAIDVNDPAWSEGIGQVTITRVNEV